VQEIDRAQNTAIGEKLIAAICRRMVWNRRRILSLTCFW
jgi:hypothetical protein